MNTNLSEYICRWALCVVLAMALFVGGGRYVYRRVSPYYPSQFAIQMSHPNYRLAHKAGQ